MSNNQLKDWSEFQKLVNTCISSFVITQYLYSLYVKFSSHLLRQDHRVSRINFLVRFSSMLLVSCPACSSHFTQISSSFSLSPLSPSFNLHSRPKIYFLSYTILFFVLPLKAQNSPVLQILAMIDCWFHTDWTYFTDSLTVAIVILFVYLSVHPFVCHTGDSNLNAPVYPNILCTQKCNPQSLVFSNI